MKDYALQMVGLEHHPYEAAALVQQPSYVSLALQCLKQMYIREKHLRVTD